MLTIILPTVSKAANIRKCRFNTPMALFTWLTACHSDYIKTDSIFQSVDTRYTWTTLPVTRYIWTTLPVTRFIWIKLPVTYLSYIYVIQTASTLLFWYHESVQNGVQIIAYFYHLTRIYLKIVMNGVWPQQYIIYISSSICHIDYFTYHFSNESFPISVSVRPLFTCQIDHQPNIFNPLSSFVIQSVTILEPTYPNHFGKSHVILGTMSHTWYIA